MVDKDEYTTCSSINMVCYLTNISPVCKVCEVPVKLNVIFSCRLRIQVQMT